MWILKSVAKGVGLLFASIVLWGLVSLVLGGSMLTPDPAVKDWIGRASAWMIYAILLTPFLLDALQRRFPLSNMQRGGLAFIVVAVPFQIAMAAFRPEALTVRPEYFTVSGFHFSWGLGGVLVGVGLALLAERLSRLKQDEPA